MRIRGFAWVLGAIAALLTSGRQANGQRTSGSDETERPEVRSLTLSGVRSVDRDELLQSIATSSSRCKSLLLQVFCPLTHSAKVWEKRYLDRTELRRDVLRVRVFYWMRGYRQATVDTSVVEHGRDEVAVTFRIAEGPPTLVRAVNIQQMDTVLKRAEVARLVELKAGEPLSLIALDSSVAHIRMVLQDRGHADARVDTATAVDTTTKLGDVTITVNPRWTTIVGPITITGNTEVSERTIRNSLSFHTGELFRRKDLSASQRRLYESGLFQRATITAARTGNSSRAGRDSSLGGLDTSRTRRAFAPSPSDSVRHIEVVVNEAPPRISRVSGGFNTFDFIQVDGRFTHNNFFGGARRLGAVATLGNLFAQSLNGSQIGGVIGFQNVTSDIQGESTQFLRPTYQGSVDFTQPWFFSPQNSAVLGVFAYRRLAPGVFVDRGEGANVSFTREVTDRVPVSLTYRFELTGIVAGDVYFCLNYGVCDLQTIAALRERQRIAPLGLTANLNRQNDPLEPSRG